MLLVKPSVSFAYLASSGVPRVADQVNCSLPFWIVIRVCVRDGFVVVCGADAVVVHELVEYGAGVEQQDRGDGSRGETNLRQCYFEIQPTFLILSMFNACISGTLLHLKPRSAVEARVVHPGTRQIDV